MHTLAGSSSTANEPITATTTTRKCTARGAPMAPMTITSKRKGEGAPYPTCSGMDARVRRERARDGRDGRRRWAAGWSGWWWRDGAAATTRSRRRRRRGGIKEGHDNFFGTTESEDLVCWFVGIPLFSRASRHVELPKILYIQYMTSLTFIIRLFVSSTISFTNR